MTATGDRVRDRGRGKMTATARCRHLQRRRLPRNRAFAAATVTLFAILGAAGAPSPLLIVYQQRYGIQDAGLTGALVIYILPAAGALLCCGRISDHLGRRPVAVMALAFTAAGCLVLTQVHGLPTLLTGRALQGVGTGLGTSALGALVTDLQPDRRPWLAAAVTSGGPAAGLALGALISGALVDDAPAPRTLVYLACVAVLALAAAGVLAAPETSPRTPGARRSLSPRLVIPPRAVPLFLAACCCFVAAWALGGFYQALGPSLAARVLGHDSHLFGGVVVASMLGTSALGGPLTARLQARAAMLCGCVTLVVGTLAILAGLHAQSVAVFLLGGGLAGLGFGSAFTGGMRRLLAVTQPDQRAGVLSAAYLISYLGAAAPSLAAGLLTGPWGLRTVANAYGALVILLVLIAITTTLTTRARIIPDTHTQQRRMTQPTPLGRTRKAPDDPRHAKDGPAPAAGPIRDLDPQLGSTPPWTSHYFRKLRGLRGLREGEEL